MIVVVPMAGRGSRFLDAVDLNPEYANPKPLIKIKGKPMVQWAIESLTNAGFDIPASKMVFICRKDHEDEHQISKSLRDIFGQDINVLFVEQITRGAAETVLIAKDFINTDEDLIVSDPDHYFDGTSLHEAITKKEDDVAGIIPVWKPPDMDPRWSYALFDDNKNVLAVGEKDADLLAKGAYANIGGYYFSSGKIFVEEVEKMIEKGEMYGTEGKKEFYVAPVYHRLVKKGHKIKVAITPDVWGLGTPKDVEYFIANFEQ